MQTDHSAQITVLRERVSRLADETDRLAGLTAADLLEIHDATGLSLDNWPAARQLVEKFICGPITENGA